MSQKLEKLKGLLRTLFQLDQPDLDFGIYRILHARRDEVTRFLDEELLPQVREAFASYRPADKAEIEKELARVVAGIEAAGMNPNDSPKVNELRARLANDSVDLDALESEVYDHLFSFFRRYYSEGDFLAKRVYKPGVYAIPYEGEEVALHWANRDQYYIKTSEYLRDYAFRLRPESESNPMRVHFRLVDAAEGEHGNVKPAEGKDRRFKLAPESPIVVEGGELIVRFIYEPDAEKQQALNEKWEAAILSTADPALAEWLRELGSPNRRSDGTAVGTRLRVHLDRYAARNTFDYFIHKDLGGFLRRELDFYVKNEVMHLDDIESETAPRVEQYLSKIKVIRKIAHKIIDFLAQLEDFQKKLWLKAKLAVETRYLVTVKCIPEEFYSEIVRNGPQCDSWVAHRFLEPTQLPLSAESLTARPSLTIDTAYFDASFSSRLIDALGEQAGWPDGVVWHGENLHALLLMQRALREEIRFIYIDPPYNTGNDGFLYKDTYQHSTWLTAMDGCLTAAWPLLEFAAPLMASIDEGEQRHLWHLLGRIFGDANRVSPFVWKRKAGGSDDSQHIASEHEYILTVAKSFRDMKLHRVPHESPSMTAKYNRVEGSRRYYLERLDKPSLPYVKSMDFPIVAPDGTAVWPPQPSESERSTRWRWGQRKAREDYSELVFVRDGQTGPWRIYTKTWEPGEAGVTARSLLIDAETVGRNRDGTEDLTKLFGGRVFNNPKPLKLIRHLLSIGVGRGERSDAVLDFFAGSGTTGHATIALNREHGGRRRFILIEAGECFDTVLLPRLQKVIFSPDWKDGAPERLPTSEEVARGPRVVKVLRLESYEDTLNNLELRRTDAQASLLEEESEERRGFREDYLLRYMLDVESRGSQSLLNVRAFTDPTAYKLKVKRPGSDETREVNVDLLETFNWLIGLTVHHIAAPRTFDADFKRDDDPDLPADALRRLLLDGRLREDPAGPWWFRTVTGTLPDGRRALVIWRKLTGDIEKDNLVLDVWFQKQGYSAKDSEFDVIYVNGGSNLENLKTPDDRWKVRLLEEDFHRLMFETDDASN